MASGLTLPVKGMALAEACAWSIDRFGPAGYVLNWTLQLTRMTPVLMERKTRWAPRVAMAAGVAAYRDVTGGPTVDAAAVRRLGDNLLAVLATCGEPGFLAAQPRAEGVASVAERLAQRLMKPRDRGA